jgi:glyoxylase-like metal-dependent hydrolase (beta-lactamase superfamily II)
MTINVTSACLGSLGTNAYLVEAGRHVLLVDPAADGPELRALVGDRRVDFVVDTHGHFDHVGGNWAVPSGAVCIHEADVKLVSLFFPQHPPIQRMLRDGEDLVEGVRVLHTPGHSPGSVILALDGVLLTGDLLFAGSVGRTDFPGGSDEEMNRSLRKLLALSGDYVVYPGHGEATTLERERRRNPFLRGLS